MSGRPHSAMHDRRRAALQALFQFDCGRASEPDAVRAALAAQSRGDGAGEADPDSLQLTPESVAPGLELAARAWERREDADRAVAALAEDWPTHRQPTIDRAILRLAHYELAHTDVPAAVAIDEAVELAKSFGTERSAAFVNAVLDRVAAQVRSGGVPGGA